MLLLSCLHVAGLGSVLRVDVLTVCSFTERCSLDWFSINRTGDRNGCMMVDEEVKQSSAETRLSFRKAETCEQTPKTPLTVSPILCLQDSFHLGKL